MIEKIIHNDKILGIILRNEFNRNGVSFFTPDYFSQQLAFMKHPKGKLIEPHVHNFVKREIFLTKEVLFIKKGSLRADFYTENREYLESRILYAGDAILLASGGHGFEVLENTEMIEVKQGPFAGEMDKTRFEGVKNGAIKIKRDENEIIYTG